MNLSSGKLPKAVDNDDDSQQVFTTTALKLPQPEEKGRATTFNSCYRKDEDESAPPLPPKPLTG